MSLTGLRRLFLAATVACTPLYAVRFHIGPLPTTVLELLIVITLALHALVMIRSRSWRLHRTPLDVPAIALVLAAAIGVAVAVDARGALGEFRAFFVEPVLLFYVAVDVLETPDNMRLIAGALVLGATGFAVLNLGAWAYALVNHQTIVSTNAPAALGDNPNAVAMFLEPAVAVAAGFALYTDVTAERIAALACLALLLTSMVLTLSRAGLLTIAVLAVVAAVTRSGRRARLVMLGAAVVAGVIVSRVPPVAARLAHQLDPNYSESTLAGRLQIWRDTLRMLREHTIFGAGLRSYTTVVRRYVDRGEVPQLHAHDVWLAMWSEVGLLGLVAFAALVAILLWRGWRGFATASGVFRSVLWGTSAGFVVIVVHGVFDTTYLKNDFSVEFWMLAALEIAALAAIAKTRGKTRGKTRATEERVLLR